jgi:hypothetical protein
MWVTDLHLSPFCVVVANSGGAWLGGGRIDGDIDRGKRQRENLSGLTEERLGGRLGYEIFVGGKKI